MSTYNSGACVTVAKGGVGESGASSLLVHTVTASLQKVVVLRTVESSLCPNTGAVAMLVVNGIPVAQGDITAVGTAIQPPDTVKAGDVVSAVVHTVPKFNQIACIRLGELNFTLDECDLV